jgi:hypothetical protein
MNTLGITDEDLKFLAKKSPDAVINALGFNQQRDETYQAPPRSSQRTDNFSPAAEPRDLIFYEKMRKEDPKKYFNPDTSVQRLKDMDSQNFLKRYQERST